MTFRPRSSICSRTFLTGFGHFHESTWSGTIKVASTLGDHYAEVVSKLSQNTAQTFPDPVQLETVCRPFAWLTYSRNGARLWLFSAAPVVLNLILNNRAITPWTLFGIKMSVRPHGDLQFRSEGIVDPTNIKLIRLLLETNLTKTEVYHPQNSLDLDIRF